MNGAASMTTALPYLKQFDLSGQVALVTGSARGLGPVSYTHLRAHET